MTRVLILGLMLLSAACERAPDEEAADEMEQAPVGPGSDSSALIPPDTPQSRSGETMTQTIPQRDSIPR
jgi:hypothetical protein